jgi:hypothetical protein
MAEIIRREVDLSEEDSMADIVFLGTELGKMCASCVGAPVCLKEDYRRTGGNFLLPIEPNSEDCKEIRKEVYNGQ